MKKKPCSQEMLKLIACATMLLDHIGAVFLQGPGLRIVGRLAFPLYAFLLSEGVTHTRSHKNYCIRLAIGALLAEVPFDCLFFGGFTWQHQSVMVTLLLGALMILWGRKSGSLLISFPVCFLAAEAMCTDYGGWGIAVIAVFAMTANLAGTLFWHLAGLSLIFLAMGSYRVDILGLRLPIQLFGLLALIPIGLYSGRKATTSKWVQWGFYLFYPVHMALLLLIKGIG